MKKAAFYTFGCKVNQYETEQMRESFIKNGYEICDFEETADVYVINTCSVTAVADKKSRQTISRAARRNENAVIVVTGCFAQTKAEQAEKIPGVDIVIGNNEKVKICEIIDEYKTEKISLVSDIMQQKEFIEDKVVENIGKTRAFIKIQDGCDNYCSYCIIPYARGHRRSRDMDNIRTEAEKLAEKGYSEIVLTGIHLTSYGTETKDKDITDVLEMLHKSDKIKRIRLGSLELNKCLYNVVEKSGSFDKLCPQFHISLQSGCETVLKRMNRRYTPQEYLDAVKLIYKTFKNAAVTTDIIVGFPGETEEEFETTLEFVKSAGFAKVHIFPYSPREGTPAAKMENQVDETVKKRRVKRLQEVADRVQNEYFESCMGKTFYLLAEQKLSNGMYVGHLENYMVAEVYSNEDICKKIVKIKVTNYNGEKLFGTVVK